MHSILAAFLCVQLAATVAGRRECRSASAASSQVTRERQGKGDPLQLCTASRGFGKHCDETAPALPRSSSVTTLDLQFSMNQASSCARDSHSIQDRRLFKEAGVDAGKVKLEASVNPTGLK